MVFFALTRTGYEEFARLPRIDQNLTLWVNTGILSDVELTRLRATGLSVTNFTTNVEITDSSSVDRALETIKEHHPRERVWVER
jgi:hypothetical protein